jgi:tRNA nucleotidyltransferase (CCA-adding enzyme)
MSKARWEHFSHGADVGVSRFGESVEQAFEQAALALSAVGADISTIASSESIQVHSDAPDLELLLMSWFKCSYLRDGSARMFLIVVVSRRDNWTPVLQL